MDEIHPTVVLDVVGLSGALLERAPRLNAFCRAGEMRPLATVTPAVTCAAQSTFLTGLLPSGHGCVANGWYFRDLAEVWFWRQCNRLVEGEKIWDAARRIDPGFTCANLFWWYNMYADVDFSATPRPMYPADGRKIPDVYAEPPSLRHELTRMLGVFPLFHFWGPRTDIRSSRWIAESARLVFDKYRPSLTLVYLPHLDYCLQRLGPSVPSHGSGTRARTPAGPSRPDLARDLREIDALCGDCIDHFLGQGARVVVLSEYAVHGVSGPIHINRVLREAGFVRIRDEMGTEKLDAGASEAFAVADHQIAHVYVRNPKRIEEVRSILSAVPGIESVLGAEGKREMGLDHPRSGELVALADFDRWFTYYFWLDDALAPDYARTVDIHRKPGYDPAELFVDPKIAFPGLKAAWKLALKKAGFRVLLDLIPLDAGLVRGSHGRVSEDPASSPIFATSEKGILGEGAVRATDVKGHILHHLFGERASHGL